MKVKKGEIFNSVKVAALPRNSFDLTHQHVTTINFADLVPICVMEAVPGDIFNISCETFLRLQPLITPMMHRCDVTVHYFYVPNRILWEGWEDFITGNLALETGLNTPAAPYFKASDLQVPYDLRKQLLNYMGFEVEFGTSLTNAGFPDYQFSALPMAAYQKVYYDYYIPRELTQFANGTYEFTKLISGDNGANKAEYLSMRKKGWGRDYFTSALPYAQKGDAVMIPMEGQVSLDPLSINTPGLFKEDDHTTPVTTAPLQYVAGNVKLTTNPGDPSLVYDPNGTLIVSNSATTINDLRRAMRLQEWLEKNARAGTRYSESLRAHFDVISSDARLQRAEYITGVKTPIIVSEVLNTAGTEGELPQGNMSGHGIAIAESYGDSFYCEEHGFIIGMLSATPKAAYSSGVPRMFTKRSDFMDYFWNEFANIGEQEIELIELQTKFAGGDAPTDTFGFIPRYAEYKFKNDLITGDFADNGPLDLGSLRTWVMQRQFGNGTTYGDATLNPAFIVNDIQAVAAAPFAITDTPLMVQQLNKVKVSRQMPVYGTPTF